MKKGSSTCKNKRKSFPAVAFVILTLVWFSFFEETCTAANGASQSKIMVSAQVQAHTDLTVLHQISELVVTEEDIRRGYLEVRQASHIEVWNNTRQAYLLVFSGLNAPFEYAYISGLGTEVQVSAGESWVPRHYIKRLDRMKLSYRFTLSDKARPGTYIWPIAISAHPPH